MTTGEKVKMELKDKKVIVVGLARSGVGAANLLTEMGAVVTVTDIKPEEELADSIKRLSPSVTLALGGHPDDLFNSAEMIVVSPGVPLELGPVASAKAEGVTVIGELELAYRIIQDAGFTDSIPFLAVTGSNGKSTTTTLLDLMLRKSGFRTLLGGNTGYALTEGIYKIFMDSAETPSRRNGGHGPGASPDFIVAEVSSFQLEGMEDFRPSIAAILNITPDHLDRYASMAEYINAKARIFKRLDEGDCLLLNRDDPETAKLELEMIKAGKHKMNIFYFSRGHEVKGVYYRDGKVYCNIPDIPGLPRNAPLIDADEIMIRGVHNLENAMAASAMALLAGSPPDAVREALREFRGLEHRLEFVRELDGVKYINDSKGTNVGAVAKSIESFHEPLILIAGGRDKAGDFSMIRNLVSEKVKALVLIGEASEKIRDALGDITETVLAEDLMDAVMLSREMADPGDVVLLSPACASFDMFQDFEERGGTFRKIVGRLGEKHG